MARNPILTGFRKRAEEVVESGGNERAGESDSSEGGHISAEDLRDFDFLDFGAGNGRCINFANSCLGGGRGLGIEKKRESAQRLRNSGYECIHGDVTSLEFPRDAVRFVTMSHFLEHLPDASAVRDAVEAGATARVGFPVHPGAVVRFGRVSEGSWVEAVLVGLAWAPVSLDDASVAGDLAGSRSGRSCIPVRCAHSQFHATVPFIPSSRRPSSTTMSGPFIPRSRPSGLTSMCTGSSPVSFGCGRSATGTGS